MPDTACFVVVAGLVEAFGADLGDLWWEDSLVEGDEQVLLLSAVAHVGAVVVPGSRATS